MAARNHAAYVADAVASVVEQDYEPLELIAIDDASDDATADVLEDCAVAAPPGRMVVVRHERQQGIAATRAHALRLAEGDFVGLLDSDDLWLPGKVQPQVELLIAEPAAGLTHADFEAFNSETGEALPWIPEWNLQDDQLVELVRRGCFIMTGTTLIRRAAIDTRGIGFVTLDYASYDDYLLYLTIALDWQIAYEPRNVMRYRRHEGNLTNVLFAGNLPRARLDLLAEFLRRFPEARDRLGEERRRTLARLLIRAAVYDRTRNPAHAVGTVLSGLRQHPGAALGEITTVLRNRLAARAA